MPALNEHLRLEPYVRFKARHDPAILLRALRTLRLNATAFRLLAGLWCGGLAGRDVLLLQAASRQHVATSRITQAARRTSCLLNVHQIDLLPSAVEFDGITCLDAPASSYSPLPRARCRHRSLFPGANHA